MEWQYIHSGYELVPIMLTILEGRHSMATGASFSVAWHQSPLITWPGRRLACGEVAPVGVQTYAIAGSAHECEWMHWLLSQSGSKTCLQVVVEYAHTPPSVRYIYCTRYNRAPWCVVAHLCRVCFPWVHECTHDMPTVHIHVTTVWTQYKLTYVHVSCIPTYVSVALGMARNH